MSNTESFSVVGRPSSVLRFTACCLVLASILAGCSDFGFFRPKLDPNAYPASYRTDLVAYVRIHPVDVLDARAAYVSAPAMKEFGSENRYFMCLQVEGADWRKEKFVVFYKGQVNQFIDATNEQCDPTAYEPFPELLPELNKPREKK
jgi:hypothetical protein